MDEICCLFCWTACSNFCLLSRIFLHIWAASIMLIFHPINTGFLRPLLLQYSGAAGLASTLFILSMDVLIVFYSIIRPHKAASFNTVKRAKNHYYINSYFQCFHFNIPPLFVITNGGRECVPDLSNLAKTFYFWVYYVITVSSFLLCFLLVMNSAVIHTLRTRLISQAKCQGQKSRSRRRSKSNE